MQTQDVPVQPCLPAGRQAPEPGQQINTTTTGKHCEGKILASSAHGCARSLTHSCWSVFLLLLFHVYVCVGAGAGMCEIQTHVCAHACRGQKLILGTILHRCSPACWLTGHRGRCSVGPAGQHAVGILAPCILHPHPVPHGPGLTGAAMPEQHLS